ncbi:MAG: prepilin-type N-terminal cleavage/methylation domain-containing protein [Candidatus Rokubacteria bacterium]|nr:prepilin-type N-terminal cleavage/methylation domain-containing protein [Candidatus Rokubacteria bacterium]
MSVLSRTLRDRRGFTLAELLVVCAVAGLVLSGTSMVLIQGNQIYLVGSSQIEAQQAARAALQRMAQEIQAAGYDPQGLAGQAPLACPWNPIVGASPGFGVPTATSLTIQNDNNGLGCIIAAERVWYNLSGTNLQRQDFSVDAAPQTFIGGVQALTFAYLDINGNPTTNTALIRSVDIALTTQPERVAGIWQAGRVSVTMRDRVRLRNR